MSTEVHPAHFVELIRSSTPTHEVYPKDQFNLYGRLDRCNVYTNDIGEKVTIKPSYMTTRPDKRVSFEYPFCFVMSPSLLSKIPESPSLFHFLNSIIALESKVINDRFDLIRKGKLDHVLMIFSPSETIPVVPANIEGIHLLLCKVHPEAARRFLKVMPFLEDLSGPANFQRRIDLFQSFWDDWHSAHVCMWFGECAYAPPSSSTCPHCSFFTFDEYCTKFDALEPDIETDNDSKKQDPVGVSGQVDARLLLTREMMYKLLSCNRYFGFDGYTYDNSGNKLGEEFLTINRKIDGDGEADPTAPNAVHSVLLSEFEKFHLV